MVQMSRYFLSHPTHDGDGLPVDVPIALFVIAYVSMLLLREERMIREGGMEEREIGESCAHVPATPEYIIT